MPKMHKSRGKIFNMRFDAALNVRKATKPKYVDFSFAHLASFRKKRPDNYRHWAITIDMSLTSAGAVFDNATSAPNTHDLVRPFQT